MNTIKVTNVTRNKNNFRAITATLDISLVGEITVALVVLGLLELFGLSRLVGLLELLVLLQLLGLIELFRLFGLMVY